MAEETYTPTGQVETTDDTFLTEDELEAYGGQNESGDVQPGGEPAAQIDEPTGDEPTGDEPTGDDPQPQVTPPATPTPPAEPKLLAGKYKDETELKNAFIELGGDPAKYDTPEKLEEAYLVRQAEFSRVRQHQAELERLNQSPTKLPTAEELMAKIDWTQIKDGRDMFATMYQLMSDTFANLNPQMSPQQLAEQLTPIIREREAKMGELNTLEGKVPRLKNDPGFRRAFALHVKDQKVNGSYKSLDESMKDFVGSFSSIIEETQKLYQPAADGKAAATAVQLADKGGGQSTGGEGRKSAEDAILDGILEAHQSHQARTNIGI